MSLVTPRKGYKSVPWLFGKEIEIPQEWEIIKLKELVVRGNQGINTAIDKVEYVDKGIPILKAGDIKQNLELSDTYNISQKSYDSIPDHHKPKKNDILYSNIGSALGTAMLVTVDTKMTIAWNVFRMVIKENQNSKYLIYFLNKYDIWNMLKSRATQSTMPFISKPVLLSLNILLPPLPEQQKIANILSNVDNLIESTEQVITHSKRVKKGLMQKLLTRGIGHVTFKKVPWLFGKEIEIPEEWEVLPLSKICNIRETDSIKCDLYVGLEHISQKDNKLIGQGTTKEFTSNTNSFHNNDVLYGKLRPLLNKVWLATEDGHCSTDILPLQTKDNIIPTILLLILTDNRFFWYAVSTSSGTKMPRTNWSDMKNFLVFLPSISEQQKIASILSNIDAQIDSQTQYKDKLEKLKKSLMQKLLTGEVRV